MSFEVDPKLVALGDQLFHDRRLSRDNSLSCASCHLLSTGGTDRKPRSAGVGGVLGGIKAPTVYNSSFNLAQFWDGRAESLEIQAAGPVHNPVEMNSSWPEVISKLSQDASMVEVFGQLFSDGITGENIAIAIAAFEKTLVTEGSRFDRWLSGEQTLSERELRGYRLFKSYGCISCHQGANVGGNLYAYMGAKGDYFKDRNTEITEADYGRYNVTGEEDDKHYFKVPSLRLAAVNSPYFHDGSVSTLDEAIRVMGRYQLGREIPDEDIRDIVAFLHTLVGKHSRFKP
ncbi:MAG: cytochrome-c peroxidase [Candidatus Thiodiazotropha lotti]|uniref:cytochrome-c peroxidase n=1 Tax=Candidatus Thiodiazotropha endoloripes TaxID=1818881 RepID=UPI001F17C762|nr:cytochrome-c peroxidase [Candidatus Thiodiazotropha endoloripes]MCG7898608.1 cytochrome-c peroxidase [Candidatus Thiodiazotropha weberae]MCG7992839.1 cytochrome-c peroxidase [Candidatus Thiodiazotropha lotti]MCG7901712.1 cytochrome-c peroxidase [Candidatus Thiodiazotropha weberae]MCG7912419.1 cytochrome-c peroxidase [Candidatus Thiodiazotropha weberae]MCG7998904.1 cytochrome-c peroxidase [Candidatus Thiodiazotropha lotti]